MKENEIVGACGKILDDVCSPEIVDDLCATCSINLWKILDEAEEELQCLD